MKYATLLWLLPCWCACNPDPGSNRATGDSVDAGAPAAAQMQAAADSTAMDDFRGCPEGLPAFGPGLAAHGEHFEVTLIAASPAEPERYLNSWEVEIRTLEGAAVEQLTLLRSETFMPIHGHDGRVQPEMNAIAESNTFQIERLNFTMRGPWEVRLWLRDQTQQEDYVVFEICVTR